MRRTGEFLKQINETPYSLNNLQQSWRNSDDLNNRLTYFSKILLNNPVTRRTRNYRKGFLPFSATEMVMLHGIEKITSIEASRIGALSIAAFRIKKKTW